MRRTTGIRSTFARLVVLALVAGAVAVPAGMQLAAEPAAAATPPTGTPGGGLFHVLSDPRAGLSSPYENQLVVGPDGRPWFTSGDSLYSITEDEVVVPHPLPGAGRFQFGQRKLLRAPDGALWTTGPAGILRVTADGAITQVAAFPDIVGQGWGLSSTGTAVVSGYNDKTHARTLSWVSADGAVTTYADSNPGGLIVDLQPGPGGSAWGYRLFDTAPYAYFPDGSSVRLAIPAGASFPRSSGGDVFVTSDVNGLTTIAKLDISGAFTKVAAGASFSTIADGDVVWGTATAPGRALSLHRLKDPSWNPVLPPTYHRFPHGCWQPQTGTLWLEAGEEAINPNAQTTLLQVSAQRVTPRATMWSALNSCQTTPDGTLWASESVAHEFSQFLRVSPDAREVTYSTYGGATLPPWIATNDGVWTPAADHAHYSAGIGHLTFASTARIAGSDRFDTAARVSKKAFPSGARTVYLASGLDFPDALSAGPAAAKAGGPLLLTTTWALPAPTTAELIRLTPTKVVLVGGTTAVSAAVEKQVRSTLPHAAVERRAGADRYATARSIVSSAFSSAPTVYVATGSAFPDALSASAAAGAGGSPVVLVDGRASSLPAETQRLIARLHPSKLTVVGGRAVVSDALVAQLTHIAPTTRLAGADRFATASNVAMAVFPHAHSAYLANGTLFPDALSGAVLAATTKAPLLTMRPDCVAQSTVDALMKAKATAVTLVGGENVLTPESARLDPCTKMTW